MTQNSTFNSSTARVLIPKKVMQCNGKHAPVLNLTRVVDIKLIMSVDLFIKKKKRLKIKQLVFVL